MALFRLVLNDLLGLYIKQAVVFHCWPQRDSGDFLRKALVHDIYLRFVNLDYVTDFNDFEVRFLDRGSPNLGILFDYNCLNFRQAFQEANRDGLFRQYYHWLVVDREGDLSPLLEEMETYGLLSIDADFTYINWTASGGAGEFDWFTLYDIYSNGQHIGGRVNVTADREIACSPAECRTTRYLSKLHERSKYNNRQSMQDVTIRVATVVTKRNYTLPEPEVLEFLGSQNGSNVDNISRFGYTLFTILRDMMQCNVSHEFTDRWSTTEIFGGTVGFLANRTVDITSTPFFITKGRLNYLRPISNTGSYQEISLFRTPHSTVIQGSVFLKPFNSMVWYIFGAVLLLASLFLWTTFRVECRRRWHSFVMWQPSLLSTFLIAFGSACSQGTNLMPGSSGGRIAFATISFFCFIMYNYYTSIVVAILLGSPPTTDIKTLSDLADSKLEVGFEPKLYIRVFLNTSVSPHVRRLVERKIKPMKDQSKIWMSQEVGIKRLRDQPGFAYVLEAAPGYLMVAKLFDSKQICDLNEFTLRPDNRLYSHLHRNSTYKELVRLRDMRISETGVFKKHYLHWVPLKSTCFDRNYIIDVGLEYTAPLFIFLVAVYGLVLFLLAIERLAYPKNYANMRIE